MTDNEIIKAYECLLDKMRAYECENVSIGKGLITSTLDLINRQKAEVERLKADKYIIKENGELVPLPRTDVKQIKAEAIKEILLTLEAEAESSDKYIREYDDSEVQRAYNKALWKSYDLVKEMTEGGAE